MPATLLTTEEDVTVKSLLPLLAEKGYDVDLCEFKRPIPVQHGRRVRNIHADVVVYGDRHMRDPLLVVETKPPKQAILEHDRAQAISCARLLDTIAPRAVVTNGYAVETYDTFTKRLLHELPDKQTLLKHLRLTPHSHDYAESLRDEARRALLSIDSVQAFKRILKACHNHIRNNVGCDPVRAFDELSKILFCKLYEEARKQESRFSLAFFDEDQIAGHTVIHQIFNEMVNHPRYAPLFSGDPKLHLDDRTIRKIVELFQDYDLSRTDFDVKGEAFEFFLGDTFTGGLGQYFTPRNVVRFMVELIEPGIGDAIIDPFCGTGGFLIFAFHEVEDKIAKSRASYESQDKSRTRLAREHLVGIDWEERTSRACMMNMIVHGDGGTKIFKQHGLLDRPGEVRDRQFQICLTNPPFGSVENDPEILEQFDLGKGRKSQDRLVLAIERAIRLVKPGGQIGIVVQTGVLNNASTTYVRDYIKNEAWIQAVVALPPETFEGYGGRSDTTILFLERKSKADRGRPDQDEFFMAVCQNAGYAPNGDAILGNELPAILEDYRAFSQRKPLSEHLHTWSVADLADRLDAQYYWPRSSEGNRHEVELSAKSILAHMSAAADEGDALGERVVAAFDDLRARPVRVGELLHEVADKRHLDADQAYDLIGVRWWGGGTFVRGQKLGQDIKARSRGRVQAGWFVYNRLFAYRGSFALVSEECADGYVSSEFPTFVANEGVADPDLVLRYLVHTLNAPQYLLQVDSRSRGSTKTSRNRFMQTDFLEMEVAMPTDRSSLEAVVEVLDMAARLQCRQEELLESSKALRQGIAQLLPLA